MANAFQNFNDSLFVGQSPIFDFFCCFQYLTFSPVSNLFNTNFCMVIKFLDFFY